MKNSTKFLVSIAIASAISAFVIMSVADQIGDYKFFREYHFISTDLSRLSKNVTNLEEKIDSLSEGNPMKKAFAEISEMNKSIEVIKNSAFAIEENPEFKVVAEKRQKLQRVGLVFLFIAFAFCAAAIIFMIKSIQNLRLMKNHPIKKTSKN